MTDPSVVRVAERRVDRRVVAPAVGAWASTAGCTLLSPRASVALTAVASALALAAGRRSAVISLIAVGVAIGAGSAAWHVRALRHGLVPRLASQRADADLIGRLVRDPVTITTTADSRLTLIDVTATEVLVDGWRSVNAPILVLSYGPGWDGLLPGQRVEVTGRLGPPRRGDDVAAVLDARAPPTAIGRPPWWQRAAGRVRAALVTACRGLPADERGLLPGLVDGDVAAEPAELTADMRLTGLTHLQAVSGENVSVILAVTIGVARAIGLRRRARIVLTSVALLGFVVLARPSPSVLRAAVMGTVVLLAVAAGRKVAAISALAAAILVLVCANPFLARSVGFVLSVCATAAILTVAPQWSRRLSRRMPTALAAAIAVPAAAQVACTPVLVLAFGQLTPYAVPANLLAAPAVVPATILGVASAMLASVRIGLAVPVAWLAALPTALIAVTAHALSGLPGAGLRWSAGAAADAAVAAVICAVALRHRARGRMSGERAILGRWPP